MRFLFVLSILSSSAFASETCKHDVTTAKAALADVFAGEKALHAEKSTYSTEFGDIGYDPNISLEDNADCDLANWSFEIQQADSGRFLASAYSRVNGQEVTINEKKDIVKKDLKISSSPME